MKGKRLPKSSLRQVVEDEQQRGIGFRAVVLGGSAGGMSPLLEILTRLPKNYPFPILVAHHLHKSDSGRFAEHLASRLSLEVAEAFDKQGIEPGHVYVAPADYHLLVERGGTLALSVDPKVNWARPSIDVLFESAARVWREALIGIILSGANCDGARGMKLIGDQGGLCVAQDPATAESPVMPQAAIDLVGIAGIGAAEDIGEMLLSLAGMMAASCSEVWRRDLSDVIATENPDRG